MYYMHHLYNKHVLYVNTASETWTVQPKQDRRMNTIKIKYSKNNKIL